MSKVLTQAELSQIKTLAEDYSYPVITQPQALRLLNHIDALTAELKRRDELAGEPVAYFAAAPDYGWGIFKNKEDAIATCQAEIDAYRDCRDDGWDDDVQRVCWGVVLQKAEGFDQRGIHTSNSNHTYQTCDYRLEPTTYAAPPAPAVPDEQSWDELCRINPEMTIGDAIIRSASWNACRAAMLANKEKK